MVVTHAFNPSTWKVKVAGPGEVLPDAKAGTTQDTLNIRHTLTHFLQ